MMYAFCRNLCNALVLCLCLGFFALADAATNAPRTGLEGGQRHGYGPDVDGKRMEGVPAGQTMYDAYGNPIVPEEDQRTPRDRLRSGAYGGVKQESRPLPDLPETDAGWNFK